MEVREMGIFLHGIVMLAILGFLADQFKDTAVEGVLAIVILWVIIYWMAALFSQPYLERWHGQPQ